jgi:Late exocytosis, associated with Golgi transport/Cytosolic domain of 10TM putative phosphate transporter
MTYYDDDDAAEFDEADPTKMTGTRYVSRFFWNWSNLTSSSMLMNSTENFDSNLIKAEDVSVDAVVTSLYFNAVVFVLLMCFYECLRRLLPSVYSSRKRMMFATKGRRCEEKNDDRAATNNNNENRNNNYKAYRESDPTRLASSLSPSEQYLHDAENSGSSSSSEPSLPDDRPLDWIGPVFGVPWNTVRQKAGLDGYFFLRYIRMNVRITAVSTFWFFLILVPLYGTGNNNAPGWYHLSAANLPAHSLRMWMPCIFLYLFSAFIFFVIKQEYRHYLQVRQDFLARGSVHVHPQHHYSLVVENIPYELRSATALKEYFDKLFPGSVHSATVVLKLPDLEEASVRCMRSCRRLEKSIAYLHATGRRPTHIVGRGRVSVLGIDLAPLEYCGPVISLGGTCTSTGASIDDYDDDDFYADLTDATTTTTTTPNAVTPPPHPNPNGRPTKPARGTRVDSIAYYTHELAAHSRILFRLQQRKVGIAETGNHSIRADQYWLERVVQEFSLVGDQILDDSVLDNALQAPSGYAEQHVPQAEAMTSSSAGYGTISAPNSPGNSQHHRITMQQGLQRPTSARLVSLPMVRCCCVALVGI